MPELTPETINSNGVITATDADGRTHHFHTDPTEAKAFAQVSRCLCAGVEELGLLLHCGSTPDWIMRRQADGRNDEELRRDWIRKVTSAGMSEEAAIHFLEARLSVT
jgi:hypothetical protein